MGLNPMVWAWPFSSNEEQSLCFSIPRYFGQFYAFTFSGNNLGKVHKDVDASLWCG